MKKLTPAYLLFIAFVLILTGCEGYTDFVAPANALDFTINKFDLPQNSEITGWPDNSDTLRVFQTVTGEKLTFEAADGFDNSHHLEWDFGDGSETVRKRRASHIYEKPGRYEVKLYMMDLRTCVRKYVYVRENLPGTPEKPGGGGSTPPPVVVDDKPAVDTPATTPGDPQKPIVVPVDSSKLAIIQGDTEGYVDAPADFTDKNYASRGDVTRTWNFGDGTGNIKTTDPNIRHVYKKQGVYTVKLIVGNSSDTSRIEILAEDKEIECNNYGRTGINSSDRCTGEPDKIKWEDGVSELLITPHSNIRLVDAAVYSNVPGALNISILYNDARKRPQSVSARRSIAQGFNQIKLDAGQLGITLRAGTTYKIRLAPERTGIRTPALENIAGCRPSRGGDNFLAIDYAGHYVLFDLKYCYE